MATVLFSSGKGSDDRAPPRISWLGKPECRSCKHYAKGKCRLFIDMNYDNKIVFARVDEVRADERMCGPKGVYWSLTSDFDSDQPWYSGISSWLQE